MPQCTFSGPHPVVHLHTQDCCQRLHKGKLRPTAVTPEMVLRARYTAMALGNAWYLKDSRCGQGVSGCTPVGGCVGVAGWAGGRGGLEELWEGWQGVGGIAFCKMACTCQ